MPDIEESVLSQKFHRVIDNRQILMVDALKELLNKSKHLDMAVGYFYLSGVKAIERSIEQLVKDGGTLRILMGNKTNLQTTEVLDEGYQRLNAIQALVTEIKHVNSEEEAKLAHNLSQWIADGNVQIRVYTGDANYFHAKSYLMYRNEDRSDMNDGFAIVGSSNFSKGGLLGNTELNTVSQDNFGALALWFQNIWDSNEVSDFSKEVIDIIDQSVPKPTPGPYDYISPEETYLIFSRYFAKRLGEPIEGYFMENLFKHQKIGVGEMRQRLDQFGTAILCDGVGLGKTRTAAATICATNSKSALILASRKLHDQWKEELRAVGVPPHSYYLASKEEIGRASIQHLKNLLHIDLVIIDEAHQGIKNNSTKLYRNLSYIKEHVNKNIRGLLLTATPWNNSRSDIFNLGSLFLNKRNIPPQTPYYKYLFYGSRKASKAIEFDDKAFAAFWRDLFLQRTRKTYGGSDVTFAKRHFPVVEINYEPRKEKAFAANSERISRLHLPYMNPIRYADSNLDQSDFSTARLKLLFLKRADSSWPAFKTTLDNILDKIRKIYKELKEIDGSDKSVSRVKTWLGYKYDLAQRSLFEWELDVEEDRDSFEFERISNRNKKRFLLKIEKKIAGLKKRDTDRMIKTMIKHAKEDMSTLEEILFDLDEAFSRKDEKYEKLRDAVKHKLDSGEKVLLITQFRDTAVSYYDLLIKDEQLVKYNMGLITGARSDWKTRYANYDSKEEILNRFSPQSKNKEELIGTTEEIQLIIGTETLSVGQNLQDAKVLMNIDLPYNPMNLEQRIGRIDRPRADGQVQEVEIYTFPSMAVIEAELKMTERLKRKLEGVYQDTLFDDLVLPQYRDFLNRILEKRDFSGDEVQEMVEKTVESTIVPISSDEHSVQFIESQKRMREAIEKARNIPEDQTEYKIKDCSLSFSSDMSTAIVKIILKDVNGNEIDQYLRHVALENNIILDLSSVERYWHEAKKLPIRYENLVSLDDIEDKKRDIIKRLREKFLIEEISNYNEGMNSESELEDKLVDSKVKKVIAEIQEKIKGQNRIYIANKIRESGYEPKVIKEFMDTIQFLDRRYNEEEITLIDELYQNVDQLWDNFKYYYESLVLEEDETIEIETIKRTARKASSETSVLNWEVGNIVIK